MVPPITIMAEGGSIKRLMPPPLEMARIIRIKAAAMPAMVEKSMVFLGEIMSDGNRIYTRYA
jgi:hypothetical protein